MTSTVDLTLAINVARLVNATYATSPGNLTNAAGTTLDVAGTSYTVITTIYANDLATDMNPGGGEDEVSIGLVCQDTTGNVIVALRGTEGTLEWIHDAEFFQVPCPFLTGAGHTDDGFTAMYASLRTGTSSVSPKLVTALPSLKYPRPVPSVVIGGHSLGGALATLLGLDLAANSSFTRLVVYTYGSPRVGDSLFANTFDQVVPDSYRIANRVDIIPTLPPPIDYQHVLNPIELNPVRLLPLPPKVLVKFDAVCEHSLTTYMYLLSLKSGDPTIPLESGCQP